MAVGELAMAMNDLGMVHQLPGVHPIMLAIYANMNISQRDGLCDVQM